ncbi:MAG: AraC family transcriptional regulator [Cytophagia bacterium]|nr:MAG: AraC family transcriptional regulator [Cytophagales bacterium]TAG35070.1 MAG: AraC family transcriptional regulator [Cytophagia bacterium]TAG77009.1 MAG: AraC family transcriptional regulator [Cytophagales bacterium]
MSVSNSIIFFISTIGWFNGIILSFYFLFFVKNKTLSNQLLGFLLLCLSLRISKSVIWYFNPQLPIIFVLFGLCVCLFIGPLLYLYIKSTLHQSTKLSKFDKSILVLTSIAAVVLLTFFSNDLQLWKKYLVKIIYAQWFLSVLGTCFLLLPIFKNENYQNFKPHTKWVLSVYFSNLMIALFFTMSFFKIFNVAYISGAIAFSFLIYLNFLIILHRKKTINLFSSEKYLNKKIESAEATKLIKRLEEIIEKEDIYGNSALKLSDLANQMDISAHQLSQLLNDNLQKSFSTYLTEFRIKKSCELMASGVDLKIEAIGYEVGFQSKSTFFAAFKKIKGTTPSLFKETHTLA